MLSEWVYRSLLVVYPREHRREYEELMVQLFRDRMRRDGGGFRGLVVWTQMLCELVGATLKQHKEEADMTKRMWLGTALFVALLVGVVAVSTVLVRHSRDETFVVSWHDLEVSQVAAADGLSGADGIAEAMRQAVEEGLIGQEVADALLSPVDYTLCAATGTGTMMIFGREDSGIFPGPHGFSAAMRRAVEEGRLTQEGAGPIVGSFHEDGRVRLWHHASFPGKDGMAEAMQRAVEESVITGERAAQLMFAEPPAGTPRIDGDGRVKACIHFSFSWPDGIAVAMTQAVEGVIVQETLDQIQRAFHEHTAG